MVVCMAFPKYQILTSTDLSNILLSNKDQQRFCFILGSGASVESGIPSGGKLEMEWMNCLMGISGDGVTPPKDPERTRNFAEHLFAAGKITHPFDEIVTAWEYARAHDCVMSGEYYFDIFRLRFHPNLWEGPLYLEKIMSTCKPSLGYHPLALMLTESSRHNLVITTNFDNLVEDSLSLYTNKKPLIINHEALANFMERPVQLPVIAKVHRGLMFDPFNSPDTTDHLEKQWKNPLGRAFQTYTPIVIGYAGADQSLMHALEEAHFQNGIYWCYRKSSGLPNQRIQDFVEKQNGCLVETDGFDALMLEIGTTLYEHRISPSGILDYFQKQADRRKAEYTEQWNKLDKQSHIEEILKSINTTEEYAREKRAAEQGLTYWDHFNLADAFAQKGDYSTASKLYTLAIEMDPMQPIAHNNRGNCFAKLRKYNEAIKNYTKAIELDPNYAPAYNNRGNCYENLRDDKNALCDYNAAIKLEPNYSEAYYNRGSCYMGLEDYLQAIRDYNSAIELDPNYINAYLYRGYSYSVLGQEVQAIQDYDKAIGLNPDNSTAYNLRGISYCNINLYEKAIKDFTKAIKLSTFNPVYYRNRAFAYRTLGKKDLADADEKKLDAFYGP